MGEADERVLLKPDLTILLGSSPTLLLVSPPFEDDASPDGLGVFEGVSVHL